jgi:magnesium-transporting ATPase (P-type)
MVVGMTVMRKANVVIRDLSALEALGGITNICSDKTGTLTQGSMIVKNVWLPKVGIYTVNNSTDPSNPTQGEVTIGPEPAPNKSAQDEKNDDYRQLTFDVPAAKLVQGQQKRAVSDEEEAELTPELEAFLRPTALCNSATVLLEKNKGEKEKWETTGEPTEIALQVFACRFDFGKKRLESDGWKQVAEFPFDSGIKRMSVVYRDPDTKESMIYTKGAVERILDLCSSMGTDLNNEAMTDELKEHVIGQMDELAGQGQRVLAVASRTWDGDFPEQHGSNVDELRAEVEQNLTLIGLVGIYDPPRDETKDAIRECSEAGIKVHMLTVSSPPSLILTLQLITSPGRPPGNCHRNRQRNRHSSTQSLYPPR